VLPIVFLTGLAFSGMGLVMTSLSPSYDFFMYYFTLAVTPMMLTSGVFFPIEQLPHWLQMVSQALPLTHAVELVRPLMTGNVPGAIGTHAAVLTAYAVVSCYVALVLARRRLLK
jgi:lipooligosaccharide transport system permease protein